MTEELERRKHEDRRTDPEAWSPSHRRMVKTMFGLVVGGSLILASVILLFWAIVNDRVEWPVLAACLFVMVMGLIAGMPSVFMPVFSTILKKIPWGKVSDNGEMTQMVRKLEAEDEGDD